MVQRRPGPYAAVQTDLGLLQLRQLLLGFVLWQLDPRLDNGWPGSELVGSDHCHLRFAAHLISCHVLQQSLRQCLPHWLSRRGSQCLRHVGLLLRGGRTRMSGYHLVRHPALLRKRLCLRHAALRLWSAI